MNSSNGPAEDVIKQIKETSPDQHMIQSVLPRRASHENHLIAQYTQYRLSYAAADTLASALRKLIYYVEHYEDVSWYDSLKAIDSDLVWRFLNWTSNPPSEDVSGKVQQFRTHESALNPDWRPFRTHGLSLESTQMLVSVLSALWKFGQEAFTDQDGETPYFKTNPWRAVSVKNLSTFRSQATTPKAKPSRHLTQGAITIIARYALREGIPETRRTITTRWVAVLYLFLGGRVSDIANATTSDIRYDPSRERFTLRLVLKGRKEHHVPWLKKVRDEFRRYRIALGLPEHPVPEQPEYLIQPMKRQATSKPVSRTTLYRYIKDMLNDAANWAEEQGSYPVHDIDILRVASPHWLRHGIISALVNTTGLSIHQVQDFVGHSSYRTTEIYRHSESDDLDRAAETLINTLTAGS